MYLQMEYAWYNKETKTYNEFATLVGNFSVPTGSVTKTPATGFGAPTGFAGATYFRSWTDWYLFTCDGVIVPATRDRLRFGNEYLYQFGFGHNMNVKSEPKWLWAWMIELNGQYTDPTHFRGLVDPDSGGNFISATPSIWISSKKLILQFGVGLPIQQHWFGDQQNEAYLLFGNIGWTF